MSKKRKRNKRPISTIRLEIDNFYNVHDGSRYGHPGKITNADYLRDEYKSVLTETKNANNKNIPLHHPTDERVKQSFIKPRPFLGSRSDYGDKHYQDMAFHPEDELIVKIVNNRKPILGKWLKKRYKKKNPSIDGTK